MIELVDLTKKFNEKTAIDNLNIKIFDNSITAFLGPNGAGKTTTIKIITGLLSPSSGSVLFDGKELNTDIKKNMAYIPDFPFLYEYLTAHEFLEFIAAMNLLSEKDKKQRVDYYLEVFDLMDIKFNLIKTFSHGLKQRLVFCAALIKNPSILIIDEPMVGLDPKTAKFFKKTLKQLAKSGTLIFLSTHQLAVAEELADQIAIINKGVIIKYNTPENLLITQGMKQSLENYFLTLTNDEK